MPVTIPGYEPPVPSADDLNDQPELNKQLAPVIAEGAAASIILGEAPVKGKIFALDYNAGTWTAGVLWGVGPCNAFVSVFLNGEAAVAGVTRTDYLGSLSQTADSTLAAAISGYTDTLVVVRPATDIPMCYSVFVWTDTDYRSIPSFFSIIQGLLTDGGTVYSASPAQAMGYLIEHDTLGVGLTADATSLGTVITDNAATVITEPRRLIGLVIDKPMPFWKWMRILRVYASCWFNKRGSTVYFTSDRPRSSDQALTVADWEDRSFVLRIIDRDRIPTQVEVVYTDTSENVWRERTVKAKAAGVDAGSTPRRVSRVRMTGVTRETQAHREAEERLNKLSRDKQISFIGYDNLLTREIGDVITVTRGAHLSAVEFRITSAPIKVTDGGVQIQGTEYGGAPDYSDVEPADRTFGVNEGFLGDGVELDAEAEANLILDSTAAVDGVGYWSLNNAGARFIDYEGTGWIWASLSNVNAAILDSLTGLDAPVPVVAGDTLSYWAEAKADSASGAGLYLDVIYYNSSGVSVLDGANRGVHNPGTDWGRFGGDEVVPANAIWARPRVVTGTFTATNLKVRRLKLEQAPRSPWSDDLVGNAAFTAMALANERPLDGVAVQNPSFSVSREDGKNRPSGWFYGATSDGWPVYLGPGKDEIIVFRTATSTAWRVDPTKQYRVRVWAKGSIIFANGLDIRVNELDTELDISGGDFAVASSASGGSIHTTAPTRVQIILNNGNLIAANYQMFSAEYAPTSSAKWASLDFFDNDGAFDLYLEHVSIEELLPVTFRADPPGIQWDTYEAGGWSPADNTLSITGRFFRGSVEIASRLVNATLDIAGAGEGDINATVSTSTGEANTATLSGDISPNVTVTFTHTASGVVGKGHFNAQLPGYSGGPTK